MQSAQPAAILRHLIRSGATRRQVDEEILRQARELAATHSTNGRLTASLIREKRRYLYAVVTGQVPGNGQRVTGFTIESLIDTVGTVPVREREARQVIRTRIPAPRVRDLGSDPETVRQRVFERFRYVDATTGGRELTVSRQKQTFKTLVAHLSNPAKPHPWQPEGEGPLVDRLIRAAISDYRRSHPEPGADAPQEAPAPQAERTAQPQRRTSRRAERAGADAPGQPAPVSTGGNTQPAAGAPVLQSVSLGGIDAASFLDQIRRAMPALVINDGQDPRHQFKGPFWFIVLGAGGVGGHLAFNLNPEVRNSNEMRAKQQMRENLLAARQPVPDPLVLGQEIPPGFLPHRLSYYDGDRWERKNLGRQACNRIAVEGGYPKVATIEASARMQVLSDEPEWLLQVDAYPEFVESVERLEEIVNAVPPEYTVILIDTVDNWASRKMICQYFVQRMRRKGGWISAGNESVQDPTTGEWRHYGQVCMALRDEQGQLTPSIFDWAPELLEQDDLLPSRVSCGEVAVHVHQTRHLNTETAQRIRNFTQALLNGEKIDYCRIDFDVNAGWTKEKNTQDTLNLVGRAASLLEVRRRRRAG